MLGNLGGSTVLCHQYRMGKKDADISCPVGTLVDPDHIEYGLISAEFQSK